MRVRQIPNGKALSRSQVHAALADLVAWNFLSEIKGVGRSASRYIPNWPLVWPRAPESPCVPIRPDTNELCVPSVPEQDPSTVSGLLPEIRIDGINDSGAPAGPGVAAYAAAGPAAPEEGFNALYEAYGVRKGRPARPGHAGPHD
jgi:hypothetical protein